MGKFHNHANDVNKDHETMEKVKATFIAAAKVLTEELASRQTNVKIGESLVSYDNTIGTYTRTLYAHTLVWNNKGLLRKCLSAAEKNNKAILRR